eukprot:m.181663 g.181663  ORF g.181663 m.181663 type:complete len:562 (-) comp15515_c0_seq14:2131-3816(-)
MERLKLLFIIFLSFIAGFIFSRWTKTEDLQKGPTTTDVIVDKHSESWIAVHLRHEGISRSVRLSKSTTDDTLRETLIAATGLRSADRFGLVQEKGNFFTASMGSLTNNGIYNIVMAPNLKSEVFLGCKPNIPGRPNTQKINELMSENGVVFSKKPARLPRVVFACLGTGRYRDIAIAALKSAVRYFGGDCEPSFHLLSDNSTDVDEFLNPGFAPYREWPMSGLMKFKDILTALEDVILAADYFYFLDADVRFMDHVLLSDISGDLVGVEHPMYPRYDLGWCKPEDPGTRGWCQYPYDRNPKSNAYIPEGHGRYVKEKKYVVSNSYYLQSAFWGGKSLKVVAMFKELIPNIEADNQNGIFSRILQDERHFNYYFWKHSNDSSINFRILPPSYLYPFVTRGFTDWVTKENRAIITHGIGKKSGKLIKGATDIMCEGNRKCVDLFSGKPVGLYSCNHVADSQGFIFEKSGIIRTASRGVPLCLDGTAIAVAESVNLTKCSNTPGMQWTHNAITQQIINKESGLCLDPLTDPDVFKERSKMLKPPLGINKCIKGSKFQMFKFRPI